MRTDEWRTPAWLFDALDAEFGFDLDACAAAENALCKEFLEDALSPEPWPGKRAWMNPPYERELMTRLLDRAATEGDRGAIVVALLPLHGDTDWWHDLVVDRAAELRFLRRRVAFVPPPGHHVGQGFSNRPRYASVIAIYGPGPRVGPLRVGSMAGRNTRKADWNPEPEKQGSLW